MFQYLRHHDLFMLMCQCYDHFTFKTCLSFVHILCSRNVKEMSKLSPLGTKMKWKFFEGKNIYFLFFGTKIKICYILMDEKVI